MNKDRKKKGFPWGIFLAVFILLGILSLGASTGYIWYIGRSRLQVAERYNKKYFTTMVEALANVAELSYSTGNYSKLRALLAEKMGGNGGIEAFFVLSDGKIVAHSNSETEKALQGNIANDEFAYNLDLILLPLRNNGKETLYLEYSILDRKIPFTREQRLLIKKFLYPGIQSTGWLATRAVYYKGKAIGTLNYIIAKDRIYEIIIRLSREAMILLSVLQSFSAAISLFVAVVAHLRYRRLLKPAAPELPEVKAALAEAARKSGMAPAEEIHYEAALFPEKTTVPEPHKTIKDAIPIVK